ncbi:MAG: toll/interleukin-1 receptor domain-containing protein, partial [SAR324 cluster bacterium]|nr:toll/interleukin-1 receptor domain-containing protein [SAR324 cluster bacterium]
MPKPIIFISHITEEKEIARSLKEFLEKQFLKTITVFASSNEESLTLGDKWMQTIQESVEKCEVMIVLCSPVSITRNWINFEAGAGWIKGIPVIPLCHSGLTPGKLPVPINSFQGGLLNSNEDITKLFKKISEILHIGIPDSTGPSFFEGIKVFEKKVEQSLTIQDTIFIWRNLFQQIHMLKYCIYASTLSYQDLQNKDWEHDKLKGYEFTFRDISNAFNVSLLMMFEQKSRISGILFEVTQKLKEDIKFILSYQKLTVPQNLSFILEDFFQINQLIESANQGMVLQGT